MSQGNFLWILMLWSELKAYLHIVTDTDKEIYLQQCEMHFT